MGSVIRLSLFWLLLISLSPSLQASEEVRIGVLAKRGTEQALAQWSATADYLSSKIDGYRFELVPLDFDAIGPAVASGKVDFILANSGFYVEFETRYGVSRIATMRNFGGENGYTQFGGVIFTRSDRDDIDSIEAVVGRRFSAVQINSLGGFLMAWRELHHHGIDPFTETELSFAGTHDAVVYAVLEGRADVGTVRSDTLERMTEEGKIELSQIKVLGQHHDSDIHYLHSTPLYPEWPFAKLRHTSERLSHAVATALLEMPSSSAAARNGRIVGWTVPRNYQPVHDLMRELHVGPYRELGRISASQLFHQYWHWLLFIVLLLLLMLGVIIVFGRLNTRLRLSDVQLRDARDNLAERVRERTAELEESRAHLERISRDWNDTFDAIDDPIFIHDAEMRIVQANPAYCERAGAPIESLRGERYYDHFPKQDGPLPACLSFPETLQQAGDELTLEGGEIYISRSFAIHRADGTSIHAIHILEDVTAERRAEEERRTLSRAVEQTREGVLLLNQERDVIYCNPALKKLIGRDCCGSDCTPPVGKVENLVKPAYQAQLQALFTTQGGEENHSGEMELIQANGDTLPVYLNLGTIYGEGGEEAGYVITIIDLSQLKQAEAQLTHRIALESLLADLASRFVGVEPEELDKALDESLKRLANFSRVARAYLFHYDEKADSISNTHEWCATGISRERDNLQQIPFATFPWLKQQLLSGNAVNIEDVANMPPEASAEQQEFIREEIGSLFIVPLIYAGRFVGFIGLDYATRKHNWSESDAQLLRTAAELIANTVGRIRAVKQVRQSEASLAAAQHIAHLGNWDWNIASGELVWSDEIYRIFGLTPRQFAATYEAFLETVHPDDRDFVVQNVNLAVSGESRYDIDHRITLPNGEVRTVHERGDVIHDTAGKAIRMIGTVQDVTAARRSEQELKRLNRALLTLSRCNTTLVHANDEQDLLQAICTALVETGGYPFAWVGYAGEGEDLRIKPMAYAGHQKELFDHFQANWDKDVAGEIPATIAIHHREPFLEHDIGTSQGYAPWREAALAQGYRSVVALPLISQDELYGALTIDANETDAFDDNELALLKELAGDLAFGIYTLRSQQERRRAEQTLRATEQRYEALYENAPNAYLSVSAEDGALQQFNQALCDMLGYSREKLATMKVFDLYAPGKEGIEQARNYFKRFQQGQAFRDAELQMRRSDNEVVWVSVSADPVFDQAGKVIESRSIAIDITARKRAEIEEQQMHAQLQRSLLQTIQAISLTIEKRDPYTAGHQEQVAELAVAIAEEMGLEQERIEGLRLGALVHDIGKISVPAEILNRPGRLEPELTAIIKAHPRTGYEIIKGIEFPWPLAEMVKQHHERLDGSGYPSGLKGDEILLEARILAVADVIDAMVSHRPYRPARGIKAAMEVLEEGKGTLFDEQVVESCRRLYQQGRLALSH